MTQSAYKWEGRTTEVEATILGADFFHPGAFFVGTFDGTRSAVVEQGRASVVMHRFLLVDAITVGGETVDAGELVEVRSTMTGYKMGVDALLAKGWRGWKKGTVARVECESEKMPKRQPREGEKEYSPRPNFFIGIISEPEAKAAR